MEPKKPAKIESIMGATKWPNLKQILESKWKPKYEPKWILNRAKMGGKMEASMGEKWETK